VYQLRDERDRFPPGSYIWHTVDVAVERIITGQPIYYVLKERGKKKRKKKYIIIKK